jgi:hypothetical protein
MLGFDREELKAAFEAGKIPVSDETSGGWMAFCGRSHGNIELGRSHVSKT